MNKKVAVDDKLTNVRQALSAAGYDVIGLTDNLAQAGAVVVSGMDSDFLGNASIVTEAPVINASGYSAEEIVSEIQQFLG